ncbi:DNA-binding response regulator [Calothrix sp. HK-06]|nr:DNA-binding response regulator [Calothrix sp. HK-06]
MSESIRVLIADNHSLVRAGLALILKNQLGNDPVAQASNGAEAVKLFKEHQPDVTLMDLRMPEMNGVEAITAIRQEFPNANIIVLTTYDGDEDIYRALHAGAKGYLLKDCSVEELMEAIHTVHSGKKYIPSLVAQKLMERMEGNPLSERECEVLKLVAKGMSNQKIGAVLGVREGTVKFHVNNILNKLQASDRTQAVVIALRRGIIEPPLL